MSVEYLQLIAGSVSSLIFITGTLNMVVKAWLTKDMESYSISALVLNNLGNLIYWIYVVSLPLGPIYLIHGFYTVTTIFLLVWALLYRHRPETANRVTQTARRITQTIELPQFTAQG
jgi:succinate dehydrogenase/fumarate reductase cytochrome b subunit